MVEAIDIAIVTIILSAIGITGGFLYNAHSINQNTKTLYYQISKDLLEKFQNIELTATTDPIAYKSEINNFALFMVKLVKRGILPKEYIFPEYSYTFEYSFWIINRGEPILKQNFNDVINFCKENEIQEKEPGEL